MSKPRRTAVLIAALLGFSATIASADVWTWTDPLGQTHFVNTNSPLFVWVDDDGRVYYSDRPEHEHAKPVQLTWYSSGQIGRAPAAPPGESDDRPGETDEYPGETEEEREERLRAEAYYCKRVTEIYDEYVNAPELFRTDDNGKKIYLTESEKQETLAETKARKDEACR